MFHGLPSPYPPPLSSLTSAGGYIPVSPSKVQRGVYVSTAVESRVPVLVLPDG